MESVFEIKPENEFLSDEKVKHILNEIKEINPEHEDEKYFTLKDFTNAIKFVYLLGFRKAKDMYNKEKEVPKEKAQEIIEYIKKEFGME